MIPPLQPGGVHEAVTAPLPTAGEVTLPVLPKTVLVVPLTPTETGLLVFHVSGTPVRSIPALSVTVAFTVVVVPLVTVKEVAGLFSTASDMDCTGHVVNGNGWLLTPPALANTNVIPGLAALAVSWFRGAVVASEFSVTELGAPVCPAGATDAHVNGPTDEVISALPLKAEASYKVLSGPDGAPAERQLVESVVGWLGTF